MGRGFALIASRSLDLASTSDNFRLALLVLGNCSIVVVYRVVSPHPIPVVWCG